MKKRIIVIALWMFTLAACSPVIVPDQTAENQAAPVVSTLPVKTTQAVKNTHCQNGICIVDLTVQTDGEFLSVYAEMESDMGGFLLLTSPQFSRDININLALMDDLGKETSLFVGRLPGENIQCYTGDDIPWLQGKMATVCGHGFPLNGMNGFPTAGDQIHVQLPDYENFNLVLTLEKE